MATRHTPDISAFDFDGTLIGADSFVEFARFALPAWRVVWAALRASPWIVAWKLRLLSGSVAKERLFGALYKGRSVEWFDERCASFDRHLDRLECPAAIEAMRREQRAGHTVVIVSASIDRWIEPWAATRGIDAVIATRAATAGGKLTGRFATPNCIGPEKVRRLEQFAPRRESYRLEVWGDSAGDEALMQYADAAHTVNAKTNSIS